MQTRLSLGAVFFKKPIDSSTNTRCIFHAEYVPKSKRFLFTKSCFILRDGKVLDAVTKEGPCESVIECLKKLSEAASNAALDGYVFDATATSLLDAPDLEHDEAWSTHIVSAKRVTNNIKTRTKIRAKKLN